jgi:hypothetical protein
MVEPATEKAAAVERSGLYRSRAESSRAGVCQNQNAVMEKETIIAT